MAELLTVKETAKILKCNTNRVYDLINAGILPAIKIGALKVRTEAIEEFLETYEGFDLSNPEEIEKIIND